MNTETFQQVVAGVRIQLRRVSDIKLPDADIKEQLQDLLRGYSQDLRFSDRDRKTKIAEVAINESDIDYTMSVDASDVEAEKLEYALVNGNVRATFEAHIVPLSAWARHYAMGQVVASFYEGTDKVKLSLAPQDVANANWFLTYRESLFSMVINNAAVPLPSDFIPMLKIEGAINCITLVLDDTDGWRTWVENTLPILVARKLAWNNPDDPRRPGRWQKYLATSMEPQLQTIQPFNNFRRTSRRRPRAFWPVG